MRLNIMENPIKNILLKLDLNIDLNDAKNIILSYFNKKDIKCSLDDNTIKAKIYFTLVDLIFYSTTADEMKIKFISTTKDKTTIIVYAEPNLSPRYLFKKNISKSDLIDTIGIEIVNLMKPYTMQEVKYFNKPFFLIFWFISIIVLFLVIVFNFYPPYVVNGHPTLNLIVLFMIPSVWLLLKDLESRNFIPYSSKNNWLIIILFIPVFGQIIYFFKFIKIVVPPRRK